MDKKGKGRKKVEMAKITNRKNLLVTFSKRRQAIFKKASELATLCGVDVAVIISSPGGKLYSFGSPSVESIIERYYPQRPPPNNRMEYLVWACHIASIQEQNKQLDENKRMSEIEKKHGEELDNAKQCEENLHLLCDAIEELNLQELEQVRDAMVNRREDPIQKEDQLTTKDANPAN